MKECGHCSEKKPFVDFYKDKRTSDGLRSWCRACCSESSAKYNSDDRFRLKRIEKKREYKTIFYAKQENRDAKNRQQNERYNQDLEVRAKVKENNRLWRQKNARRLKDTRLRATFGISIEQYETMRLEQGGVCKICSRVPGKKGLAVDHCHATGRIRGLLCSSCNTSLGLMRENRTAIESMVRYLQN